MSAILEIQNSLGELLPPIEIPPQTFGMVDLGTVRIANVGDSAPTVTRITFANIDWSWSGGTNAQGQECLAEKWLEAKEGFVPPGHPHCFRYHHKRMAREDHGTGPFSRWRYIATVHPGGRHNHYLNSPNSFSN